MKNLLTETLEFLELMGFDKSDVEYVSSYNMKMTWDQFKSAADFEYDEGFGGQEINPSLYVVGYDWWFSRWEYDGSEGWEFNRKPDHGEITCVEPTMQDLITDSHPLSDWSIQSKKEAAEHDLITDCHPLSEWNIQRKKEAVERELERELERNFGSVWLEGCPHLVKCKVKCGV